MPKKVIESPTLKRFKTSVETAQTKQLFTWRVCGSEQKVSAYWRIWWALESRNTSTTNHCPAGSVSRNSSQKHWLLLVCLGLQSEHCWPSRTNRGHPVIIFCLGKWLPLSQLIYLFLPNERFTFSSGQKSEREHSGFSHSKSWAAFPDGDNSQIAEDSSHLKLVKWDLLCDSFSFHSLFHSSILTALSEKASIKCCIDIVTILLSRTSPRAWVSAFFVHWKFVLKPWSVLHELESSPRDFKKGVSIPHACVCV